MQIIKGMKGQKYIYLEEEDEVLTLKEFAAITEAKTFLQSVVHSESVAD